ncbi:MAG: 16S rRNA (guanine(527)-N(7))-methyltransferase RsmG [Lachnospiraceae bacterium]|nr:16S rRNA (guanine(527)-N(7))-methyltransferase RsmG [Lachnospiraceae bacterium]
MSDNSFFIQGLKEYGFDPTDEQIEKFIRYYDLIIEWNEKINLTAITEYKDVMIKHFLDSVSIIKAVDMSSVNSLIDIGTGAGFPGIPIKIMFPDIKITLLDSLKKRLNVLDLIIDELNLKDIYTIHGRAEDIARDPKYREKYDLCVSRAVANLSTLSELCIPYVKPNGKFVSYKSEKADEELEKAKNAIRLLGGKVTSAVSFELEDNIRTLIVIDKTESTNKKYPRKAGTPGKEPL